MIKNRDDEEFVDDQYECNENDYIKFDDVITRNQYIEIKNNTELLK